MEMSRPNTCGRNQSQTLLVRSLVVQYSVHALTVEVVAPKSWVMTKTHACQNKQPGFPAIGANEGVCVHVREPLESDCKCGMSMPASCMNVCVCVRALSDSSPNKPRHAIVCAYLHLEPVLARVHHTQQTHHIQRTTHIQQTHQIR